MKYMNLMYYNLAVSILLLSASPVIAMEDDFGKNSLPVITKIESKKKENFDSKISQPVKLAQIPSQNTAFKKPNSSVMSSARLVPLNDEYLQTAQQTPNANPVIPFEHAFEWNAVGLKSYKLNMEDIRATDEEFIAQTKFPERLLPMAEMYTIISLALIDNTVREMNSHDMSALASGQISLFLLQEGAPEAQDFKKENEKRHAVRRGILPSSTPVKSVEELIPLHLLKKYFLLKRKEILDLAEKNTKQSTNDSKINGRLLFFDWFKTK